MFQGIQLHLQSVLICKTISFHFYSFFRLCPPEFQHQLLDVDAIGIINTFYINHNRLPTMDERDILLQKVNASNLSLQRPIVSLPNYNRQLLKYMHHMDPSFTIPSLDKFLTTFITEMHHIPTSMEADDLLTILNKELSTFGQKQVSRYHLNRALYRYCFFSSNLIVFNCPTPSPINI
jgi:hypothetical protein